MGLPQFPSLGSIKKKYIYISNCNASGNVRKCWSSSKFLSWKIMSHSANPPLWLGAKGLMASERLHRRSATDINPTQGGEARENISCVSGGQGEKLQFTVCDGSTPLSYWSPSSGSRWLLRFGGTLPLLRDGRVKGQPSPNKWLKCVAARRGRHKNKVLFVSHRSPRPMGDGHTHSEEVKCKEKRLLKEMGQESGKWPNGTKKQTRYCTCSTQRKEKLGQSGERRTAWLQVLFMIWSSEKHICKLFYFVILLLWL